MKQTIQKFWQSYQAIIISAVKELLRVVVIAIVPALLAGIDTQTGLIAIQWNVALALALVAVIKAVDKLVHKLGQQTKNESMTRGLTRF